MTGCRCNVDEAAVCFVLTRALCVLFFSTTGQRKESLSCCGLWGDTRISLHRTARPTHTLPIAPRWRRLTAIEAAAKAGKVMRRRVGRVLMHIDDTAVCFVDYCGMLTRVLCVLFCCRRDLSAKKLVLSALERHTHIAKHASRKHCTSPPGGVY